MWRSAPSDRSRWSNEAWLAVAIIVLLCGTAGSVLTAIAVAHGNSDRSRQHLKASSAAVASTLDVAIQREADLVVSAGGFVADAPNSTDTQFVRWTNSVQALPRHPEIQGLGHAVLVPAADLPGFPARLKAAASSGAAGAGKPFQVIPPGPRAYYCLSVGNVLRDKSLSLPPGFDMCAAPGGGRALESRDSGLIQYVPYAVGAKKLLAVLTPVYQSGVVPVDLQQRRKAFLGWIGIVLSPNVVLSQALDGHANTAVVFRYEGKGSDATFSLGHAPKNAHSTTIDLQDGWTVRTFAATTGSSVFEYRNLLALTIFGIIMSALLAGLVFVLGTQRARALRTVTKQTGELRYQALHDALTGLPNRVLITDRIEQLLVRSRRAGTMGAALFFDLDGFKNVNDTFGHKTGDQLLQAVTARLTASLRGADTIGRLGGDEFVVLVEGGDPSESGPQRVADKLLHLIRQPFELESIAAPLTVTASVGIAIGDRDSASDLLRDADLALYQAKARGKDCYALFCADMESHARQRYALESDLRSALQNNQYRLAYQPVYNLDDLSLAGAEALLRWDHPDLGVLEPDEFIPLLESSGQILDVGKWVLIEACRQMVDWQDGCAPGLGVSVNVSARQFDSDLLVEHVRTALELSGLPPADLTIEITETDVMRDPQSTVQRLRELKALGVRLALDDFGTGYSSLAYLQHFPVDSIKIDKMFVDAMTQSPQAEALVRTLVQLGTDLGLTTLAEGVETLAQMDHLRGQHVNQAQGFLLAQPMEPGTFEEELLVHTRLPVPGLPKPRAGHDESATHIP